MPPHIVKQGEHLAKIAAEYGFSDYRTIWDHPENAELKKKRKNPNILFPGDRLFVPPREQKEESAATDSRHGFRSSRQPVKLRLVVEDNEDQPIADTPCELVVETRLKSLSTDGSGLVETDITPRDDSGKLTIRGVEIPFRIGHLDPVEEVSGQQARLNNLGYDAGNVEEPEEPQRRSAIEEFQCDQKLKVDGICGEKTQAKLKEVHGC